MNDIQSILHNLTLEEKAAFCSGLNYWYLRPVDRLGVPSIMVTDGPHGLRKQLGDPTQVGLSEAAPATCFPTASALAATWNRDLIHQVGVALGEECRQEKVSVILGPGVNIKRSPLGGRNFEYFSEDPYLTGEIAKNYINGVQSQGVGTSLKHYAANNQETRRMTADSVVDERALREIYLAGFETAVKQSQPWTVMCSYNRINGVYASDNKTLMTDILKEEWGHEGLVVTDWSAMNDRIAALKAGVDLEMPGPAEASIDKIVTAVNSGELDEAVLDTAVARILTLISKGEPILAADYAYDADAHHALARRTAGEAAVLLKNDGGILPLPANKKIALIGRFAKQPRYQGAGSSFMTPTRLDNLYDELAKLVGEETLSYAPGYTETGDAADETLIQEALTAAQDADVIVICAGLTNMYEIEALDRQHMKLPAGHDALIQRLAAAQQNVVVVLSNGAPVEMPWVNDVPAILEGYLGGQAGAGAIADILTGQVNPSGKLAETFPIRLADTPAQPFPAGPLTVEYRESVYVGYRYYDTANVATLFPFGHGLSYTAFVYSDLAITPAEDGAIISFKIKNSGQTAGKEIAQLYVRDVEATIFRPDKELKGFVKIELEPREETEVTLTLDHRAFAFYDVPGRNWVVEAGEFEILVGASSQDIRLTASLALDGRGVVSPVNKEKLAAYYDITAKTAFSQADFAALLGRPVPPNQQPRKGTYTLTTSIGDLRDSFLGRQLYKAAKKEAGKTIVDTDDPIVNKIVEVSINEAPLRSFGAALSPSQVDGLLLLLNGRYFKGLLSMFTPSSAKK
ncbi:MAG: glycoside hydrolase family 3 C-terminal domain-containing protein [Ardenticatenaceae bacterium]|nr:glycoside hydrolase family 3 C-terminal domain-containing protein [Ardenticatenaceae bacterium]